MFKHVCIVGCGLIGGSFALALRRSGFAGRITAYDGARGSQTAVERGVVDASEESFDRGVTSDADLIYLSPPVGGIIDFLRVRSSLIKPGALVTDVGSTKSEICRVASRTLPASVHFIGGHPMAGSEQSGVEYARGDLFDQAIYVLMNDPGNDTAVFKQLRITIESIGARVLLTGPEQHDRAVTLISHLPQLLATSLASMLGVEHDGEIADREIGQRLAAGGWRDMTRLAGSSWSVWRDICLTNQLNISNALGVMIMELQSLKDALDSRDFNQARDLFEQANRAVEEQRAIHYQRFEQLGDR